MALLQPVIRRLGHANVDSHGFEPSPEAEVTIVDQAPVWRGELPRRTADRMSRREVRRPAYRTPQSPDLAEDTQLELRAVAASVYDEEDWDRIIAEARAGSGDVTDVDMPALPAVGDSTLPDQALMADDVTEEADFTLIDTPTLMTPYPAPARPGTTVRRAAPVPERLPDAPGTAQPGNLSPALPAPRTPRFTPDSGSKRLTRRSDRDALARVIALAKPRTSTTRTRPAGRAARTADR